MARRHVLSAVVVAAAGTLVNVAPAYAATIVHCGQVLTIDTTVANDLQNCHTIGLVIGADGVDLNLNGHTIDGDGTSDFEGIQAKDNDDVTIRNGVVRDFVEGIAVISARNAGLSDLTLRNHRHVGVFAHTVDSMTIRNVTASSIAFSGLFATHSSGVQMYANTVRRSGGGIGLRDTSNSVVRGNQLTGNDCHGVELVDGSASNLVDGNVVTGHGCEGIVVADAAPNNVVSRNTVIGNEGGIGVAYANANTVVGNVVRDNHFVGIYLFAANDNRVDGNALSGNGEGSEGGIHVLPDGGAFASRNALTRNTVVRSVGDGIVVDGGSPATTLDGNIASENSDDGIDVDERRTTLRANQANDNGDLGIEAVRGVTDGGGNRARGNGDPRQCTHVAC